MLRAAIENEPGFRVDEMELQRPPPSYSIETVEVLRFREPTAEFFYLIGEDNVARLATWHRFDELSKMVQFVVLDRSDVRTEHPYPTIRTASGYFRHEYQKQGCHGAFHSLSRTAGGRKIIHDRQLYRELQK